MTPPDYSVTWEPRLSTPIYNGTGDSWDWTVDPNNCFGLKVDVTVSTPACPNAGVGEILDINPDCNCKVEWDDNLYISGPSH